MPRHSVCEQVFFDSIAVRGERLCTGHEIGEDCSQQKPWYSSIQQKEGWVVDEVLGVFQQEMGSERVRRKFWVAWCL